MTRGNEDTLSLRVARSGTKLAVSSLPLVITHNPLYVFYEFRDYILRSY